jgi:uncharacterized protein YjbI with pentapeptide repeats
MAESDDHTGKPRDDIKETGASERQDSQSRASQSAIQIWQHRQMILSGQPIVFNASRPESEREILGQWVLDALSIGQSVSLTNAIIVGRLHGQNMVVAGEVALQSCIVRDSIADFSHSTFAQIVDFSGTEFAQGVIFARCRFDADVMISGCRISGRGILFMDAEIKRAMIAYEIRCDPGTQVNFQRSRFCSIVKFSGSFFSGEVDFNGSIFDGQANFCGVTFTAGVIFGSCVFNETALFCGGAEGDYSGTVFKADTIFLSACFRGQAAFQGAVFKQSVSFNLARFEGFAYFNSLPNRGVPPTAFEGRVDFVTAHFLGQANFQGVTFRDSVSFNSCVISGAANFGTQLQALAGCTFMGSADFVKVRCENVADFRGAVFHQQADFRSASFHEAAEFTDEPSSGLPAPIFHGSARFADSLFVGKANFRKAIFKGRASFNGVRMKQGAYFCGLDPEKDEGVRFECEAQFSLAQIEITGNFRKATFVKG